MSIMNNIYYLEFQDIAYKLLYDDIIKIPLYREIINSNQHKNNNIFKVPYNSLYFHELLKYIKSGVIQKNKIKLQYLQFYQYLHCFQFIKDSINLSTYTYLIKNDLLSLNDVILIECVMNKNKLLFNSEADFHRFIRNPDTAYTGSKYGFIHMLIKNKNYKKYNINIDYILGKVNVNLKDINGEYLLHYAIQYSHRICYKLLFNPKLDVNVKNDYGNNILMILIMSNPVNIKLLKKILSIPHFRINDINNAGLTAIMIACKYYNKKTDPFPFSLVINHPDIDITIRDIYDNSAIDYADNNDLQSIKIIISTYFPYIPDHYSDEYNDEYNEKNSKVCTIM